MGNITPKIGHTAGPAQTGVQTSTGWYGEADVGWGGSAGASVQGEGDLFSREMQFPNATAIGVKPGYGAGAFVGYGNQTNKTGTWTIDTFLTWISGGSSESAASSPNGTTVSQGAQDQPLNPSFQPASNTSGSVGLGFLNNLGNRNTWK
jgi:hypothetical protein